MDEPAAAQASARTLRCPTMLPPEGSVPATVVPSISPSESSAASDKARVLAAKLKSVDS